MTALLEGSKEGTLRLERSDGDWDWILGHSFYSDCPREREVVDKSDELKVFEGSSPSRDWKIEGVDSVRALILRSSCSIETDEECFIGKSKFWFETLDLGA